MGTLLTSSLPQNQGGWKAACRRLGGISSCGFLSWSPGTVLNWGRRPAARTRGFAFPEFWHRSYTPAL